ncbi:MAG: enoyl-CoA hydratase/isomerase family protein [Desulfomonile tiedjei]|nr:enoyl-CoA hydratase/isomerase family protein [Desulfomonile tiedjei]
MDWKHVEINRSGPVAVVKFDRSDNLNALSLDLMRELTEAARSFEDDLDTTVVVLTGSPTAFSAGLDLRDPKVIEATQAPLGERRRLVGFGPKMCRAWEEMQQVTIAAIEGHCIGGGVSLAVSCDFRVMADGAFFRVPELGLGMNMSWQTLPRLVHLVGPARAKQIVILAEKIGNETAFNWGLADFPARKGEASSQAMNVANKVSEMPPLPVKMTKQAVNAVTNALDSVASYMETDQFILCQTTQDHSEAVSAYFEKRKGTFKGN